MRSVLWLNIALPVIVAAGVWRGILDTFARWYYPNNSPIGLVATLALLLCWLYLMWASRTEARVVPRRWLALCGSMLLAHVLLYGRVPGMITCTLAGSAIVVASLGALPPRIRERSWGFAPWMLGALPIGPSLDFYLGYPLRATVAWTAAALLGGGVEVVGTGLARGDYTVFVDAPCSGVRMLTVSLLLAGVVGVAFQKRFGATVVLAGLAILLALLGNCVRAIVLFAFGAAAEQGTFTHDFVGIAVFLTCALMLVLAASGGTRGGRELESSVVFVGSSVSRSTFPRLACLAVLASIGVLLPVPASQVVVRQTLDGEVRWPAVLGERAIEYQVPSPELARYFESSPVQMREGKVVGSHLRVLVRQVNRATRDLHPSEHCYRALGFQCAALPAERDAQGHLWSRFSAVHPDGRSYVVKQCFFSVDANAVRTSSRLEEWTLGRPSWPDSSSWYWAAARPGADVGHTLAVTIAEAVDS